jgi:hypothetical protein
VEKVALACFDLTTFKRYGHLMTLQKRYGADRSGQKHVAAKAVVAPARCILSRAHPWQQQFSQRLRRQQ